ncbi:hypothetical protein FOFC_20988 [Fusarium oxysporum]|nr:hypothetical protein FOFC_20988 [Fusarium oxysporum]
MEPSNISDDLRSLASSLFAVADEAIDLSNDESIQKASPSSTTIVPSKYKQKHDEHILRNTRDSDGASGSETTRSDEDGEASQDHRRLTTREASSLTKLRSSNDAVDKTKRKYEEKKLESFEADPKYLESLDGWIESPETFFSENIKVTLGRGICQFLIAIDASKDLNSIKRRYILRQIYLSKLSWKRYKKEQFNSKLVGDGETVPDSTIRFWIKEGEFYEFLCNKFGIGCLFCDVATAKTARTMSLPTNGEPKKPKLDKFIATLRDRNIAAVSEQYTLAATEIASYMRNKQIEAGLLKPPKRAADELSYDTPGMPLKKVCRRTGPDQPSRLMIQDSAGSSHARQSTDSNSSGGRNDGSGPQNAAAGILDDELSISSPHSTSCNRLYESLEQNTIPSNCKTTTITMSTTSTPSPAPNTDAETQPRRENSLSDRLQTEIQRPGAVSGAFPSGSSPLPAAGSARCDHTVSSHANSGTPRAQPPFLPSPSHTDMSSITAPMLHESNSMPSRQQSSYEQQQSNQFHGDDLQASRQPTIIGQMDMNETVASFITPVPEPLHFESSQNINEKSAGQGSATIVAHNEEEEQHSGSSHRELQNRGWDIEAGAEHARNPDTCPQADNTRTYNLLNESQDSRSATESCQSRYCPSPATNDDAMVNAGRHLRRSPTERGSTDDESTSPLLPNDVHDQTKRFSNQRRAELSSSERTTRNWGPTGHPTSSLVESRQEDTSPNVGNAYHWQTESTSNTSLSWNELPDQNSQARSMSLESSACLQGQRPSTPDSTQAEMLLTTTDSGLGFRGSDVMGNLVHNASLCLLENFDQPVLQQPGTQYQEASPQRLQSPSRTTILGTARPPQAEVNNGMKASDNLASVGDSRGHGSPQQMDPNMFWNMVATSEFGYSCWGEYGDFDVSKPGLPSLET